MKRLFELQHCASSFSRCCNPSSAQTAGTRDTAAKTATHAMFRQNSTPVSRSASVIRRAHRTARSILVPSRDSEQDRGRPGSLRACKVLSPRPCKEARIVWWLCIVPSLQSIRTVLSCKTCHAANGRQRTRISRSPPQRSLSQAVRKLSPGKRSGHQMRR